MNLSIFDKLPRWRHTGNQSIVRSSRIIGTRVNKKATTDIIVVTEAAMFFVIPKNQIPLDKVPQDGCLVQDDDGTNPRWQAYSDFMTYHIRINEDEAL